MPSSEPLPPCRSQRLPRRVFRRRSGCPPLASRTIRLSAFERQETTKLGFCNLCYRDARARPSSPEILSRAGAVARFACRRFDPPGESRRVLHRRPERTLRHATSLYALCAFRDRASSPMGRAYDAPAKVRRTGVTPECAAFVDGAHHFLTTRRLSTTRRPIMASDVGRGLRAAAC